MRRRRARRRNPPIALYLIGAAVIGLGAFLLTRKASAAPGAPAIGPVDPNTPQADPALIPINQIQAGATVRLNAADCAAMRNGTLVTSQDDLDACDKLGL